MQKNYYVKLNNNLGARRGLLQNIADHRGGM